MRSATIRGEAIPSSSSSFTSDHSENAPALEQYATEFSVGGRARATSPLHYTSTLKPSAVNQPSRARVGEKSSFPADFVGADRATRPPGEKVMDQPTLAPTTNSREGGVRASVFQGTPPRERREGNDENSPQLRGGVRTSPLTQRTTAATTASTATSRVAVQKPHPNGTASTPAAVTRYRDPTSHDAAAVTTVPTSVVQREWPANASGWAEQISLTYLTCSQCSRIVVDPVQMRRREHQPLTLACRQCARNLSDAQIFDLPSTLHAALMDILERSGVAAMGGATAPQTESAAEAIAARRKVYAKRTTPGAATTAGAAATSFPTTTTAAASLLAKGRSASDLLAAEGDDRTQISLDEAKRREMMISSAHRSLRLSSAASPSSRQLKLEADKRYEDTEYTAAVELYTKAILRQPEDGLTQLRYLYGNRSAALFMAQQYEACVADCLAAVEMEPTNTKMRVRAARSAAMMGDLRRAISILEAAPPQSGSESLAMDLAKYKDGLENLIKAEKLFGTTEGDERYRMLSAQFPDTTSFRLRYAESLAKQRQYHLAIETLSAVAAHFRTPPICLLLARCLYLSGFAQFETAIKTLEDASQLDADCAALLERIRLVDEHKENGNNYFKRSMFAEALDQYTLGIKRADDNDQVLHILYCNRAAAAKELGRYREAVEDCTKALELNADFFKAYARRARCHILLGDNFAAVRDFKKAMEIDDSDNTLAKDLREAEANLAKEGEKDKDYYYQLGLTRSSSEKDIKTKFRELSLRWHPDKCVNLDETEKERAVHKFKLINEAYGTLSDPAKRREYDLKTDRERLGRNGGYSSSFSNFSNDPYFRGSKMKAGNRGYW